MIVGQDKLIKLLDSYTLDLLPHSVIIEGVKGSGKHLLCKYVAEKYSFNVEDISENISQETIDNAMLRVEPYMYIVDSSVISVRDQNTLLKFIEEPLKNSFIFILCENKYNLLSTVINRCQTWHIDPYKRVDLLKFVSESTDIDLLLEIADSPGKVIGMQAANLKEMANLSDLVFDKIAVATYANCLKISDRIAFKDEPDKFDFEYFTDVLLYTSKRRVNLFDDTKYCNAYFLTAQMKNDARSRTVNRKNLFENYLFRLKDCLS